MSRAMKKMICMLAASLAIGVSCSAQAPKVIAKHLHDQFDQAWENHDLNQLLGFFDSSYVETDAQRKRLAFAEVRRNVEQNFTMMRRVHPITTVEDVQLEAGRMVVYYNRKVDFEFHDRRNGWIPEILTASGESTWERKGGQWRLVRGTFDRVDVEIDPRWVELVKRSIDDRRAIINCADGCPYPH